MSGWQARIADDLPMGGIRIIWTRDGEGFRQVTNGDIVTTVTEGALGTDFEALRLTEDLARALLDGLTRWYHGAEDTRALRKDYDAERARVDRLLDKLSFPTIVVGGEVHTARETSQ